MFFDEEVRRSVWAVWFYSALKYVSWLVQSHAETQKINLQFYSLILFSFYWDGLLTES